MKSCPNCEAEYPQADAVLCIQCGFHIGLGRRLQTDVVGSRDLSNPFAPPELLHEPSTEVLSPEDAERARRIATTAFPIYLTALLSLCICWPSVVALLPLFLYRFAQWHSMRARFQQLRIPNSLSPYAEIELMFQSAGVRYVFSITCGILWIVIFTILMLAEYDDLN